MVTASRKPDSSPGYTFGSNARSRACILAGSSRSRDLSPARVCAISPLSSQTSAGLCRRIYAGPSRCCTATRVMKPHVTARSTKAYRPLPAVARTRPHHTGNRLSAIHVCASSVLVPTHISASLPRSACAARGDALQPSICSSSRPLVSCTYLSTKNTEITAATV